MIKIRITQNFYVIAEADKTIIAFNQMFRSKTIKNTYNYGIHQQNY